MGALEIPYVGSFWCEHCGYSEAAVCDSYNEATKATKRAELAERELRRRSLDIYRLNNRIASLESDLAAARKRGAS